MIEKLLLEVSHSTGIRIKTLNSFFDCKDLSKRLDMLYVWVKDGHITNKQFKFLIHRLNHGTLAGDRDENI